MKQTIIIWLLIFQNVHVSAQKPSYNEFLDKLNQFEKTGEYEKAVDYLIEHQRIFPDKYFELSKEEISLNEKLQKFKENIKIFESGHKEGYFYFLNPGLPRYKPYKKFAEFELVLERDRQLRQNALKKSKTLYEIDLPDNYDKNRTFPVCFIFHGGGSNLDMVKKHWHSKLLDANFIKVYFQSYRHYDSNTFGWSSDDERADIDLVMSFRKIVAKYAIDTSQVLVTGISAGGTFAIDIALRQVVTVKGIIAFCPGIPTILEKDNHKSITDLSVKIFLIGGEYDYYLPRQQQMTKVFSTIGIPFKQEVIQEMGHQYPAEEAMWIDEGINYLFNQNF